eukprot:gene332-185_t
MARDAMPASTDPRASLFFSTDCDEAQQRFNPFHLSFLLYKIEVFTNSNYIFISLARAQGSRDLLSVPTGTLSRKLLEGNRDGCGRLRLFNIAFSALLPPGCLNRR